MNHQVNHINPNPRNPSANITSTVRPYQGKTTSVTVSTNFNVSKQGPKHNQTTVSINKKF